MTMIYSVIANFTYYNTVAEREYTAQAFRAFYSLKKAREWGEDENARMVEAWKNEMEADPRGVPNNPDELSYQTYTIIPMPLT